MRPQAAAYGERYSETPQLKLLQGCNSGQHDPSMSLADPIVFPVGTVCVS